MGHPKSGTTLLLSLLDSHKELCVFPEELKFFNLVLKESSFENKIDCIFNKTGAGVPGKFDKVSFPSGARDYSHINSNKYNTLLKTNLYNSSSDSELLYAIFQTYLNFYPTKTLPKYYVEKTPSNENHLKKISRLFPSHKCLHIIRDPRDNYLSYKRKHPKLTIERFCKNWRASAHISIKNKTNPNYLTIRYEDLVQQKQKTLEIICNFLDIPFSQSLLTPSRSGSEWSGNSMYDTNDSKKIHSHGLNRFKEKLNINDWELIESYLYDELLSFGYDTFTPTKKKSLTTRIVLNKLKRLITL